MVTDKKRYDVVTVGDCVLDGFVVPEDFLVVKTKTGKRLSFSYGSKTTLSDFHLFPGGNPLNTAVTFSNLGLKTAIVTVLGTDLDSEILSRRIKEKKIGTEYIRRSAGVETDKSVVIVTPGERTILSFHCSKDYVFPKNLSTTWIYLTSMGGGFDKIYREIQSYKKRKTVSLAYNPGSRQLFKSLPAVRKMLKFTELLFVNAEEAAKIVGHKDKIAKLLERLHNMGAHNVVITVGSRGAYASDGVRIYFIKAFPAHKKDATGAGDAFASGFTAAVIDGKPHPEALRWGSVNAAGEISQIGVQQGLVSKNKLLRILRSKISYKPKVYRG